MIARAFYFAAGLFVQWALQRRDNFEDRLEALEAEAEDRAEIRECCPPLRDVDGRERSTSN